MNYSSFGFTTQQAEQIVEFYVFRFLLGAAAFAAVIVGVFAL